MTVVIVTKTLADMTIVADTRVSYEDKSYASDGGILKLVRARVGDIPQAVVVFGFSGYLEPIYKVLAHIFGKLYNYKREFVMRTLSEDVRGWIQKLYPKLSFRDQSLLKRSEILLCGFDAYKQQEQSLHNKPEAAWLQKVLPPSSFVYTYRVGRHGHISLNCHGWMYIMGSGKVEHQQIEQFVAEYFARDHYIWGGNNEARSHDFWAQSQFFSLSVLDFFQYKNILSVGAPFQIFHIDSAKG